MRKRSIRMEHCGASSKFVFGLPTTQEGDIILTTRACRKWLNIIILLFSLSLFTGCIGNQEDAQAGEQQEDAAEVTEGTGLFVLLYSNPETQSVFLESVDSGRQEEFSYNGGTYIYDRYGSNTTIDRMQIGTLVQTAYTDKKVLTEIRESEDVFIYDGISNFKLDMEKKIITVADSNYYYDEALKVFSDTGLISISELSERDTICIRGLDKKILTLVITRGHGTITLKNTELFEGGMITIGNVVAQEIVKDMQLEVPEGNYTLSVANDGYGGSREIAINRFEELVIDLETLKGDGPGYCMLKITVTPSDADVTLNGAKVDCSQILELKYGSYRLAAEADGYIDWSGRLVVSSREAAVSIDLEEESEENREDGTESENAGEDKEDRTETENGKKGKEDRTETESDSETTGDRTETESDEKGKEDRTETESDEEGKEDRTETESDSETTGDRTESEDDNEENNE